MLPITINLRPFEKTMILDFEVVEDSPYQMMFGRPFLKIRKSIMPNHYLELKYWERVW